MPDDAFRQRIREHVHKAVNEAKVNTHWLHPNQAWLESCDRFVDSLLTPESGDAFLASFVPKAQRIAHLGMVNALAQLGLKITCPGVPDFYQGCELWNLSLVDPDNRRLIDWSWPQKFSVMVSDRTWRELMHGWRDGGIKLRLTQELLRFRREHLAVFQEGGYEPLFAQGRFAENLVAFERRHETGSVVVVVPRLTAALGCPPLGLVWEDTVVNLPLARGGWTDVLTQKSIASDVPAAVAELLVELPLAVLWSPR